MRTYSIPVLRSVFLVALMHSAFAQPSVSDGLLLTHSGHSLYIFDNDVVGSGTSVCKSPCTNIFPPYVATDKDSPSGDFGLVTRQDGSRQWMYKGRPLYRFYADEKPGDKGGDGMNRNLWHIARQ